MALELPGSASVPFCGAAGMHSYPWLFHVGTGDLNAGPHSLKAVALTH